MKGNSSSGYDESMKVVRAPGKNGRTETFFFREKLGKGGIMEGAVLAEFSSSGIMKCVVLAKFPGKMIVNTGNLQ